MNIAPLDDYKRHSKARKQRKNFAKSLLHWMRNMMICLAAGFLFCALIMQPIRVKGESMKNTLQNGDLMIVTKYDYILGDPERFDVVICHFPGEGDKKFVKRIVGMPGDTVAIRNGIVFVNNKPLDEAYIDYLPNYAMLETTIEEGHYFVLGDNRASSMDSHIVGQLIRDQILGHVQQVIWPFDTYRSIE